MNFKNWFENLDYKDQIFSDQNGEYNVGKMYEFFAGEKPQEMSIDVLLHNLEPSEFESGSDLPGHPDFIKRSENSSLEYPIIVVAYSDGYFVADGVHRLWKAHHLGHKKIKVYILKEEDLVNFKV